MKKLYSIILGLLLAVSSVYGQACYEVVQLPFYPFPFVGGNDTYLTLDDYHSDVILIGFDFCFFGNTYSELVISTNGYVSFNTNIANTSSPWNITSASPTPGVPDNSIMAPWQDIDPSAGSGGINYHTYGIAPYRKFVVSYTDIAMFSCTEDLFSNQIVLYESLNIIDINIANKALCPTWNGGFAIEGIENANGTEAYIVPGRNYNDQWISNGDSYRFIPQCYCVAPSGLQAGDVVGKIFWDYNQDCVLDAGEPGIPNVRFDIQPGDGIIWSGYQGNIAFNAEPSSFTMEHSPNNPWYLTNICPAAPIDVTVYQDSTSGPFLWGDTIIPYQDIAVSIGSTQLAACFPAQQSVSVCNNGNIPAQNVTLRVFLPDMLAQPMTSPPSTQNGDTLQWLFDWMDPGECRQILISDSVMCDPNLVNQVACLSAWTVWDSTDVDGSNNSNQTCNTILASYDPNDKHVRIAGIADVPYAPSHDIAADHRLEYLIRFQNTGSAAAYNITIVDTLDAALDPQTITPSASSHFYTAQLLGNVLTFHFPSILLPDSASDPLGSQGWVSYTVAQTPGNSLGTIIPNAAAIYFDNNEPVITDPSYSIISGLVGLDDLNVVFNLLPNPTQTEFRVLASQYVNVTIEVMDISGRVILTQTNYTGQPIDVSSLSQGIYPVRVISPKGTSTTKLIRN